MSSQIPQDNLPTEVFAPLAVVVWGAVVFIYIVLPWWRGRKDRKK